jgi:hypothetical protein
MGSPNLVLTTVFRCAVTVPVDQQVTAAAVVARLDQWAAETARRDGGFDQHELLGPDLFGLRAPRGTGGVHHTRMTATQGMALLDRLDLTGPSEAQPAGVRLVLGSPWPAEELMRWVALGIVPSSLPLRRDIPLLLHGIWLGGPLGADGESGKFRARFAASARTLGGQTVLWTDVPRARAGDPVVRDMTEWACRNDIRLVNVDEVFTADHPMLLDPYFRAETHRMSARGFAAAGDILRMEVLYRFGGLYMDGDDLLTDPDVLARLANAPDGFAVCGDSAVAMAKGHPFARAYLDRLLENYGRTMLDLYAPQAVAQSRAANFTPLRARLGMEALPLLHGVTVGRAHSGLSDTPNAEPPIPADDLDATVALTARVVQTLVRQLYNRPGDLHLTEVEDAVRRHAAPDLVWTAAMSFIAGVPALRARVTTATVVRVADGKGHRVPLPFTARRLLRAREGQQVEFLAELIAPVRMLADHRNPGTWHIPLLPARRAPDLAADVQRRTVALRRVHRTKETSTT